MTSFRNFAFLVLLLFNAGLIHAQTPTDITAQLNFTTIDVPGAGVTGVYSINATGDMVGYYGTTDNDPHKHGFLYRGGNFIYIDYPRAYATFTYGINDSGLMVGAVEFSGGTLVGGYTYDGTSFTILRDDNNSATYVSGINNAGWMVGAAGTIYTTKGFEMRNGHYNPINFPGQYVYGYATGINNLGRVVGWTDDAAYLYSGGKFKTINFPGASRTEAWGINDNGVIVGWYGSGAQYYGFAFKNGKFISFGYPGAAFTGAAAINASGQIVGQYTFDYQTWHGFVTSPISARDL
jgi:uncharacterized membrane protein